MDVSTMLEHILESQRNTERTMSDMRQTLGAMSADHDWLVSVAKVQGKHSWYIACAIGGMGIIFAMLSWISTQIHIALSVR